MSAGSSSRCFSSSCLCLSACSSSAKKGIDLDIGAGEQKEHYARKSKAANQPCVCGSGKKVSGGELVQVGHGKAGSKAAHTQPFTDATPIALFGCRAAAC